MKKRFRLFESGSVSNRWLLVFTLFSIIALLGSLRREGAPIRNVDVTWIESLKLNISMWYSWMLLCPLILWTDKKLPIKRDALGLRLLCHVPLSMFYITGYTYLYHAIAWTIGSAIQPVWLADGPILITLRSFTRSSNMVYWAIVAVSAAFDYQRSLKEEELRNLEAQRMLAASQLNALRAQLHPHFLFNALNAVSDYIDRDPAVARWMLEHLGQLLRILTDTMDEIEIPLAEELEFLEMYLELQAVRFGDRLSVSISADPDVLNALVPPLLLQPVVENAIVHGPLTQPFQASVAVRAWQDNGNLYLRVSDNGPGFAEAKNFSELAGVGLRNTKRRIESFYGASECHLNLQNNPGGGAALEMRLPLRLDRPPLAESA